MTPIKGEMYTVTPTRLQDGSRTGFQTGRWHCRIKGNGFDDGRITVQEMKVDSALRWKPAMTTTVPIASLVPLEVDCDLFGDPAPGGA